MVDFRAAAAVLAAAAREGAGNLCTREHFSKHLQHDNIVAAIRDTEHKTSGQIRVTISHKHIDDPVAAAQAEFLRLGMEQVPGTEWRADFCGAALAQVCRDRR